MHAGLDFAYPEASKIGGLISGPPEQGQGTAESPSGWVIAVERCKRKPQDQPSEEASTSDGNGASSPPGETTGLSKQAENFARIPISADNARSATPGSRI